MRHSPHDLPGSLTISAMSAYSLTADNSSRSCAADWKASRRMPPLDQDASEYRCRSGLWEDDRAIYLAASCPLRVIFRLRAASQPGPLIPQRTCGDCIGMSVSCHNRKSRSFDHLDHASTWRRWSFGQPGFPQSFFVFPEVFGTPIRAPHIFESRNTLRGIELPQPSHRLVCFLRPSGHCITRGVDTSSGLRVW